MVATKGTESRQARVVRKNHSVHTTTMFKAWSDPVLHAPPAQLSVFYVKLGKIKALGAVGKKNPQKTYLDRYLDLEFHQHKMSHYVN